MRSKIGISSVEEENFFSHDTSSVPSQVVNFAASQVFDWYKQ